MLYINKVIIDTQLLLLRFTVGVLSSCKSVMGWIREILKIQG